MVLAAFVCVVSLAVSVCYKGKAFIVIKGPSFTQLASQTLGAGRKSGTSVPQTVHEIDG